MHWPHYFSNFKSNDYFRSTNSFILKGLSCRRRMTVTVQFGREWAGPCPPRHTSSSSEQGLWAGAAGRLWSRMTFILIPSFYWLYGTMGLVSHDTAKSFLQLLYDDSSRKHHLRNHTRQKSSLHYTLLSSLCDGVWDTRRPEEPSPHLHSKGFSLSARMAGLWGAGLMLVDSQTRPLGACAPFISGQQGAVTAAR